MDTSRVKITMQPLMPQGVAAPGPMTQVYVVDRAIVNDQAQYEAWLQQAISNLSGSFISAKVIY